MQPHNRDNMSLAEEAAEWMIRLTEEADPRCRQEFVGWVKRSPRHMEEFLLAAATRRLFREVDPEHRLDVDNLLVDGSSPVVPLRPQGTALEEVLRLPDDGPREKPCRRWLFALAAALGGALVLGLTLLAPYYGRETYSTGLGEQRAFRLADGSLLHLNTQSRAEVRFSRQFRDVRLVRGEALFTVQHDASRPFRVMTDSAIVQAVGTQFDVYERSEGTRVAVIEGRVRITAHQGDENEGKVSSLDVSRWTQGHRKELDSLPMPSFVIAGEAATIGNDGAVEKRAEADIAAAVAWRERRLAFHGTPLAEVAEQFNRYNTLQIRIESLALAGRRITAVFNADDPQALLEFLERDPSVRLELHENSVVIRAKENLGPATDRGPVTAESQPAPVAPR